MTFRAPAGPRVEHGWEQTPRRRRTLPLRSPTPYEVTFMRRAFLLGATALLSSLLVTPAEAQEESTAFT